ncbi:hypothetical protein V8E55_011410 [Tylopilus felleus]
MWSSFSGMLTIYGLTALFTGSSVYVYAGFQGITVGLEIDDGQSVTATSPPPTPPPYPPPNVPLSELQDLPSADHTATIDLLRWENGTTSLCLDYALIKKSDFEISRAQSPVAHDVFSSAWGPINFEAFSVEWSFLPSLTPQPTSTSQSGIPRSLQTINSQIVTTSYASTSALPQSFTSQPAITSTPGSTTQPATTPYLFTPGLTTQPAATSYLFTPGLTTQPTTASSTSLEASSGLVGSAYTSAAASAVSNTGRRVRTRCSHCHYHSHHIPQKAQIASCQIGRSLAVRSVPCHNCFAPRTDRVVASTAHDGREGAHTPRGS